MKGLATLLGFAVVALGLLGVSSAANRPLLGHLDLTFNGDGKAVTGFGDRSLSNAYGVAIQRNGRVVVAGGRSGRTTDQFALARYTRGGALDKTFGSHGRVRVGSDATATAVAAQPDGKIVAAGVSGEPHSDFELIRLGPTGALDPTFGQAGVVTTKFPSAVSAQAIVIQPDGKIVVAGGGYGYFALARYESNGALDRGFGSGGTVLTHLGSCPAAAYAVALQPNDRIVAAGTSGWICDSELGAFTVIRYRADGSLDTSFGQEGIVRTGFGSANGPSATGVVVQPDGKILTAGYVEDALDHSDTSDAALVRYQPDGSLDSSFGSGGKVIAKLAQPGWSSRFSALALQSGGQILTAGTAYLDGDDNDFLLARFQADGALDRSFGDRGSVHTDFGTARIPSADYAYALAVQTNGRVVLAGTADQFWGDQAGDHFGVARYLLHRPSCTVPSLTGRTLGHARRLIGKTYCRPGRIHWISSALGKRRVISQRPPAGTRLAAGSRVNLVVSKGKRR